MQLKKYWQLKKPVSVISAETLAERISGLGELSQFAVELREPGEIVLNIFPEQPPEDVLHIIVQKPLGESYVNLYVVKYPANVVLLATFPTYLNHTLTVLRTS